jgi:hypothetical protein
MPDNTSAIMEQTLCQVDAVVQHIERFKYLARELRQVSRARIQRHHLSEAIRVRRPMFRNMGLELIFGQNTEAKRRLQLTQEIAGRYSLNRELL